MNTSVEDRILIDRLNPKHVSPVIYGWHYEEIGMIGDGGLYAEMIRNRNFSESGTAPGLTVKNGLYENIPNADASNRLPEYLPELHSWNVYGDGIEMKRLVLDESRRSYAMEVVKNNAVSYENNEKLSGVANSGFGGMAVNKGCRYLLSIWVKAAENGNGIRVGIADKAGYLTDPIIIRDIPIEKTHYEITLTATRTVDEGFFLLTPVKPSSITIYFISMFPCDTWDGGHSVFRRDIMQNLLDYKPEFLRFPGGCIVHGVNVETMYHWKETIEELPERKSSWCKWQPHWISNGIGYHEFYELCEYLGADAMYVAPCGLICTDWAFQKGDSEDFFHPDVDVDEYIQDCLDAIEYAIGPVNSYWGARRAAKGHPLPFPLKYLSIGNEDFGPAYYERYERFRVAIKSRYPDLILIANSIIGNRTRGDWGDKRKRLSYFRTLSKEDYFDEHYYDSGDWVFENFDRFDKYDRNGPRLMCLELGLHSEQPSDILYESIFLMMMEKNGDLNPIFAGRPLMRNWDYVDGELNPYYYHTNKESWKTVNYYAKKLFRDNRFDRLFSASCCRIDGKKQLDEETLFVTAGQDSKTGDIILKVVNLAAHSISAHIDAGIALTEAYISTLKNTPLLPKTLNESKCGGPEIYKGRINFDEPYKFPEKSLTVIRILEVKN